MKNEYTNRIKTNLKSIEDVVMTVEQAARIMGADNASDRLRRAMLGAMQQVKNDLRHVCDKPTKRRP